MSMKARLLFLLSCCFVAHPARVLSQVQVVAGVANQSPDARFIEVNGGFSTTVGNNFALAIKWGDDAETQGLFPAHHHYTSPGEYLVTVTAFNDRGNFASTSFRHVVPTLSSDIATIQLAQNFVGMKTGETARIGFAAFNQQGQKLSLQNRAISFYHANSDVPNDFSVQFSDTALVVRSGAIRNQDAWTGAVFVYVDKKSAATPLRLVVSKHAGAFRAIGGEQTVSYLPTAFFTRSAIADSEYNKVLDLAFAAERGTLHGLYSDLRAQAISYAPPVFGVSGNPLLLGDFALPQSGIPFFDVLIHEMGHNMHGQLPFFNLVGVPGAFYMETLAEWYVQFVLNRIIAEHGADLAPNTLAALQEVRRRNREMHLNELRNYIQNGNKFNYEETTGGSHPLVQKIFEYSDQKGWDKIETFMAHWDMQNFPAYIKIFLKYGGIQPINNRVTIMLAMLSAVFENDVRPDFRALNFPINEPFFDEFYALLRTASTVAQETSTPNPPRDFILNESYPNPIKHTAMLSFTLFQAGEIQLNIYNLSGQQIHSLVSGELKQGEYRYQWDATGLPSGIYFYRLKSTNYAQTKTLLLVR